jgi:acyl dehydratase
MEKPPLLYKDLEPGRKFKPFMLEVTEEFIKRFCEAVEDENPIHFEKDAAKSRGFENSVAPERCFPVRDRQG